MTDLISKHYIHFDPVFKIHNLSSLLITSIVPQQSAQWAVIKINTVVVNPCLQYSVPNMRRDQMQTLKGKRYDLKHIHNQTNTQLRARAITHARTHAHTHARTHAHVHTNTHDRGCRRLNILKCLCPLNASYFICFLNCPLLLTNLLTPLPIICAQVA